MATPRAFLDIPPLQAAGGTVRLPGSKSISNRVLLLAGLCAGRTRVLDLLDSDDTRVMLDALRTLGCGIEADGDALAVTGLGGRLAVREAQLFLGNAGTAMRPLAAALALLAADQDGRFELSGVPRMHERPIGDLVDALRPLGCTITCLAHEGYPPLRLERGTLKLDAPIRVRGDVSSQFLTALLMALPLVAARQSITIEVDGELISKPYIEITLALLARFGISVQREGWKRFVIPQGSAYRSPGEIAVEGDASSASYFIAAGAIAAADTPLRIEGVGSASIQGDIRFVEAARAMGADITEEANALVVRRGAWPLTAITLDCNHIPDAAMTLAAMALYATGTTRLTNIASWRVKETDRIAAMAIELRKFGATVLEGADFIEVTPPARWQAAAIHTYDDHRMAMCASLAAFNPLAGGDVPVRILDPRCVNKTFPAYFDALFGVTRARTDRVPVLTVDGPTASGKGTLGSALAERLGYHHLDSGALYRATALAALRHGVPAGDETAVAAIARTLPLRFENQQTLLAGEDVSDELRHEAVGSLASQIAALPAVRQALVELQLAFRRLPGLVADGRDMGTVIFPGAALKVFLTANSEQRASRRHKQLISKGISANIESLRADLEARDARDQHRSVAPLKPAQDARLLDNSALSVETSVDQVLDWWDAVQPFGSRATHED
ncbi:bifunctional 3-phosphoshikimate 1-carboxyvinyltransferase/cytidylate kinase [Methylibium petroleiphilum]|uniref:bifunctional 3-phosphoshikimate 1-carboxyvinyltransferase/cytidylate kinase n=1 Tax=Methylibium petroleiphilum TaxID=105560 RepID=UPI001AC7CC65|nr:bifunctional 3-phosphoshikimate 1-carboxyvinyltransferase/cytidylate kinase [Methylibium petroleiphilum]MBN9206508.1 bifunctional 3-phosphoshikimate 1-carboxyvinyltransferase/cytidylate kinase [Methylibium petroleiphilum]